MCCASFSAWNTFIIANIWWKLCSYISKLLCWDGDILAIPSSELKTDGVLNSASCLKLVAFIGKSLLGLDLWSDMGRI